MAKPARPAHPGMSFVTTATRDRRPIFEISRVAELFIDTLLHYRTLGHYKLHAYVVMPDHVHPAHHAAIHHAGTGRRAHQEWLRLSPRPKLPIWDEGFNAYPVANMHDLEIVRAHLHQLPVRAGLDAHRRALSALLRLSTGSF